MLLSLSSINHKPTHLEENVSLGFLHGCHQTLIFGQFSRILSPNTQENRKHGLAAAIGASRLIRTFLFEVSPLDPLTFAAALVLLLAVAAAATFIPARRASRIDPMTALRYE